MSYFKAIKWEDTTGASNQFKNADGKPRISSTDYLQDIAEGNVTGHTVWSKIGYCPSLTPGVNTDVWPYCATQPVYLFPTVAQGMEVLSSNAADTGTSIFSGTSTGGTTTTLIDTGKNFLGGTPVAIGDCVILDKSGSSPEYGYVTAVATTTLTLAGGFNRGGSGTGRAYTVIDGSATEGGHAVEVNYLDGTYAEKREIVVLNGTSVVATVNTDLFRINAFRIIAAGANKIPTGNITLRHLTDTPVYSYILAGFNRARNAQYTVPLGKTLYVISWHGAFGTTGKASREYARITTRANIDPTTRFMTDGLFYPFTDIVSSGENVMIPLPIPTKLLEKTDIKVSAISSSDGIIVTVLRGWIE
jgi:hypothetical protein